MRCKQKWQLPKKIVSSDSAESLEFGRVAAKCELLLSIDESQRGGVAVAAGVLSGIARWSLSPNTCDGSSGGSSSSSGFRAAAAAAAEATAASCVSPALDGLVLLFRRALLSQVGTSASAALQRWRDLEDELGVPHLEAHLPLLGRRAKALLLGLALVPEGTKPATLVVSRDSPLDAAGAQSQLLAASSACILSCYFESASGTKMMQGKRVEGGEGHGPRKEFFIAASADLMKRWRVQEVDVFTTSVVGSDNRITFEAGSGSAEVPDILTKTRIGDRISLQCEGHADIAGTVTLKVGANTLVLDKPFVCEVSGSCRFELQRPSVPLFEFHRGTGQTWFSAYATELDGSQGKDLRDRYRSLGKLMSLALANHCKLGFVLPTVFFRLLLRRQVSFSLEDLKGFDDALHASMRKCLKMKPGHFQDLKEVEGLSAELTREDYVQRQVLQTLSPVAMDEIRDGFESLIPPDVLCNLTPGELRQMLCPTDATAKSINIRHIFEVILEDEMAECPAFVEAFWSVLERFSVEEKRLFLMFVTGVETPPEPGTEQLLIQLPFSAFSQDEYLGMLDMLPQAHTCTNTLELPNYHEALLQSGRVPEDASHARLVKELTNLLGVKLRLAIHETAGYELDGILGADRGPHSPAPADASGPVFSPPGEPAGAFAAVVRPVELQAWRLPNCLGDEIGEDNQMQGDNSASSVLPFSLTTSTFGAEKQCLPLKEYWSLAPESVAGSLEALSGGEKPAGGSRAAPRRQRVA